jgi:hypothetical protein
MTDAPDWQRVVVGPGAAPIGGGGTANEDICSVDRELVGWSWDPKYTTGVIAPTSGVVQFSLVKAVKTATVTNIWIWEAGEVGAPVADESYLGLYAFAGAGLNPTSLTLLASTAPGLLDVPWPYSNLQPVPLAGSGSAVTAGQLLYVAALYNAGSVPKFQYHSDPSYGYQLPIATTLQTAAAYASLPATLTGGDVYQNGVWLWAGMS